MVSIDGGLKVYKGVDIVAGRPVPSGWKRGRVVQRPHTVRETADGVFVVRFYLKLLSRSKHSHLSFMILRSWIYHIIPMEVMAVESEDVSVMRTLVARFVLSPSWDICIARRLAECGDPFVENHIIFNFA
jgi:hypothetical protein